MIQATECKNSKNPKHAYTACPECKETMPTLKEDLQTRFAALEAELAKHVTDGTEFDAVMDKVDLYVETCCAVVLQAWESTHPSDPPLTVVKSVVDVVGYKGY